MKERIKKLCKDNGISLNKLEDTLGFGKGYLSKLNSSSPNVSNIKKIADYFGVSVDWIMDGKETESGYYLNEETAKLAQEMFEDEDMRSLFHMKRTMPPERFKAHMEFMKNLYNQEKGEDF